jgi:hypothetical protein
MIALLAVAVFTTTSSQTKDNRPANPQLIDTLNSHLAVCDQLLALSDSPAATTVDFLTGFEFDPFVFVASERSTSRLLLTTNTPNIRKITVSLSDLGPYFGAGAIDLLDGGIPPDTVAGDGVFTGAVTMLNPPAEAFGGRIIRNIGLTVQRADLTTVTLTEDVAASYGYISSRDSVPVMQVSEGLYVSRYAANLVRPDLLTTYPSVAVNTQTATTAFLQRFADEFDWAVFFNAYNQRGSPAGSYISVKNGIQGIGQTLFDRSGLYGSRGKLRGVIQLYFKHASPMSHEIFHTWGVYGFQALGLNSTSGGFGHWGPLARPGQTTVFGFPPTHDGLTTTDGGRYQGCFGTGPTPLSLELYLMGLLPGTAIGSYSFLSNATWLDSASRSSCPQGGYVYSGSGIATMSLADIVAALGPRTPPYPDQDSFRAAVITVTRRALRPEEWDYITRIFTWHQGTFPADFQGYASLSYDLLPNAPTLSSLTPNSVTAGSAAFVLTVTGANFVNGSIVRVNGSDRPTAFASSTQLTASISASDVAVAGAASIAVFNPGPGGGVSNALSLTITQPGYEADVAPRPNGSNNGTIAVSDWTQVGRFVATLDTAANGSEFQRADCAPRSTLGDGRLTAADWTQAGRYAAGEDPVVAAGGPTSPVVPTASARMMAARAVNPDEARRLRVVAGADSSGAARTVMVGLDAQGDENALGFSLRFNPSAWRFVSAEAGLDARQAIVHVNASEAASGRIGLLLALPAGGRFDAGARRIVALKFAPVSDAAEALEIGFADQPVAREIVSGEAVTLPARYEVKSSSGDVDATSEEQGGEDRQARLQKNVASVSAMRRDLRVSECKGTKRERRRRRRAAIGDQPAAREAMNVEARSLAVSYADEVNSPSALAAKKNQNVSAIFPSFRALMGEQ